MRDRQLFDRCAEPLRSQLQQRTPRFGRGPANLRRPAIDRRARVRASLIGRHHGIELNALQLTHVEIEFLARDLQQRRRCALPELRESEVDRGGVVLVNRKPGVDLLHVERTRCATGSSRLLRVHGVAERKPDEQRAAGLEKVATRAHTASVIAAAARLIALTTWGYVPQRHR